MKNSLQQYTPNTEISFLPDYIQPFVASIIEYRQKGLLSVNVALKGRTISQYKREIGEPKLILLLGVWINELSNKFHVGDKNLSGAETSEIANNLIREHWDLKLAEWVLFCDKAGRGEFGQIYGRFDASVIFEWLKIYRTTLRADEIEKRNEKKDTPLSKTESDNIYKILKIGDTKAKQEKAQEQEIYNTEIRDEKNRIALLHSLQNYFPQEMNKIFDRVHERMERNGRQTTTSVLVRYSKVKELQKILSDKFTNVNR